MKVKEDAKASPFTVNTEGLREKVRMKNTEKEKLFKDGSSACFLRSI